MHARLIGAFLVLLLLCGGALVALSRGAAQKAHAARLLAVAGPYRRSVVERPTVLRTALNALPLDRLRPRLAGLFAIRLHRMEEYRWPWWAVLVAALVGARGIIALAELLVGLPLLYAIVPVWIALCRLMFNRFEGQRREALYRQFPDALSMVVRAMRVGQTVTDSLRGVVREAPAPTNLAFGLLSDRMAIGLPLSDALGDMARDAGLPEYRFFATTLLLQAQTGGSLTEALENLAEVIRGRVALRRRAHALASEARTSAIILGVLPIVTGAMLLVVAPSYAWLLFDDASGRRVLAVSIFLLVAGALVMNSMIKKMLA